MHLSVSDNDKVTDTSPHQESSASRKPPVTLLITTPVVITSLTLGVPVSLLFQVVLTRSASLNY